MKRLYKTCDFTEESNPDKAYLQRLIYSLSPVKGVATVVSGPAIERHVKDFYNIIAMSGRGSLDIIEIDKKIYNNIAVRLVNLRKKYTRLTIKAYNKDIINVKNLRRFVDADLTATISTSLFIFRNLFIRLYQKKTRLTKALVCTFCKRGIKNFNIYSILEDITFMKWIETKTELSNLPIIKQNQGCYLKITKYYSNEITAYVFSYRFANSSPMVSILFIY